MLLLIVFYIFFLSLNLYFLLKSLQKKRNGSGGQELGTKAGVGGQKGPKKTKADNPTSTGHAKVNKKINYEYVFACLSHQHNNILKQRWQVLFYIIKCNIFLILCFFTKFDFCIIILNSRKKRSLVNELQRYNNLFHPLAR